MPDEPQLTNKTMTATGHAKPQGVRTHVLLIVAMAGVTLVVTLLFSLLLQHRLSVQQTEDLTADLQHSVLTFSNLKSERLAALDRENALLSELPTLKALMTSGDDRTVQDGAAEFWQLSGEDLFALADPYGRIVALYTKSNRQSGKLAASLTYLIASPDKHFLIDGESLYSCSSRPLYFGNDGAGVLLGYVLSGITMERTVRQISEPTGVEASFLSDGTIVASTLKRDTQAGLRIH